MTVVLVVAVVGCTHSTQGTASTASADLPPFAEAGPRLPTSPVFEEGGTGGGCGPSLEWNDGWRLDCLEGKVGRTGFASGLVLGCTRGKAGWLFLDAFGVVARSATFTGPLERVGRIELAQPARANVGEGVVTAVDVSGTWWRVDDGGAHAADAPEVLDLAFLDPLRGARLTRAGLQRTSDGGASWSAIEAQEGPVHLAIHEGALLLGTQGEDRTIWESPPTPVTGGGPGTNAYRLREGTGGIELVSDELAGARALPAPWTWGCEDLPHAGTRLLVCADDRHTEVFSPDGDRWRALGRWDHPSTSSRDDRRALVVADPLGPGLVVQGCVEEPGGPPKLCASPDGGATWRVEVLPDGERVSQLQGGRMLTRGGSGWSTRPLSEPGAATAACAAVELADDDIAFHTCALRPDGAIVGVGTGVLARATKDDTTVRLFVWSGGHATERPLPRAARAVAFAADGHGVVTGDGAAWGTTDGGDTWHPLDAPIDTTLALQWDQPFCGPAGCTLVVELDGGEPVRLPVSFPASTDERWLAP